MGGKVSKMRDLQVLVSIQVIKKLIRNLKFLLAVIKNNQSNLSMNCTWLNRLYPFSCTWIQSIIYTWWKCYEPSVLAQEPKNKVHEVCNYALKN